jgi:hypothetical protein
MKILRNLILTSLLTGIFYAPVFAQCDNWNNSPKKEDAENAHVNYRQYLKGKDVAELEAMDAENFKVAFGEWEKAYTLAPAADGQRPSHYQDGRTLYRVMYNKATDEAKRKEYAAVIMRLYDEQIKCYQNEGYLLGRKGWDMFYMPEYGRTEATYQALKKSLDLSGNSAEYIIFDPISEMVVQKYQNGEMSKEEARNINIKLMEVLDHNIAKNVRLKEYYETTKIRAEITFSAIEDEIFDCAYFKDKLVPQYRENPEDHEVIRYIFNKLRQQGCPEDEAIMVELKEKYSVIASAINDSLRQTYYAENPSIHAKDLYDSGEYSKAIDKYREAADKDADNSKKADYYMAIASIQFRKLTQYTAARDNALRAARLRSGWGQPYMLIGDMYATSARTCGNDGYTRGLAVLAAIEKYAQARNTDSSVADEANRRIGRISGAVPTGEDIHLRGKSGKTDVVPCWIGETVKLPSL